LLDCIRDNSETINIDERPTQPSQEF
jgi:hypothetical protein